MNVIESVVNFNKSRNLTNFDKELEGSFILEELLELYGQPINLSKEEFREVCKRKIKNITKRGKDIPPIDMADAFGDIIVFAIGALHKLQQTHNTPSPQEVLTKICEANDRKSSNTTAEGKIIKGSEFKDPAY